MRVRASPYAPGVNHANRWLLDSKIDLLDAPDVVAKKIRKAECVPKEVEGNGVLALVEYVLLPVSGLKAGSRSFKVERREGEPLVYSDIQKVHEDYRNDVVCCVNG